MICAFALLDRMICLFTSGLACGGLGWLGGLCGAACAPDRCNRFVGGDAGGCWLGLGCLCVWRAVALLLLCVLALVASLLWWHWPVASSAVA